MPSSPVPVLGFLFVSFRPSLLRSHSRSTGAYLFPSFDFLEVFFLAFPFLSSGSGLGFDYSAFCFFLFPFLPAFPHSGLSGVSSVFRLPLIRSSFSSFPKPSFCFGTQVSCNSLSSSLLRLTGALQIPTSSFLSTAASLAFALGSCT